MAQITIVLGDTEYEALRTLAARALWDPRAQTLFILRDELARCGLLMKDENAHDQTNLPAVDRHSRLEISDREQM
jgi:hypothetical protein